jgi:hypothetical protein
MTLDDVSYQENLSSETAELFHWDGQTERNDKSNSRFQQFFYERAYTAALEKQ